MWLCSAFRSSLGNDRRQVDNLADFPSGPATLVAPQSDLPEPSACAAPYMERTSPVSTTLNTSERGGEFSPTLNLET